MSNPIPVPVSPAAGKVERRTDHGLVVVVVRDLAHIRIGWELAKKETS